MGKQSGVGGPWTNVGDNRAILRGAGRGLPIERFPTSRPKVWGGSSHQIKPNFVNRLLYIWVTIKHSMSTIQLPSNLACSTKSPTHQ